MVWIAALSSAVATVAFEGSNSYIGSKVCAYCHADVHAVWRESLHSRIYREPTDGAVLGDFGCEEGPGFSRQDVDLVIGGTYEQMYAKMLGTEQYVLPMKWLVREQRWEPYHADDWLRRPMRTNCHGCHIVGFDHRTGKGAELNVGCEACHGPGRQHYESPHRSECIGCPLWPLPQPGHE